MAIVAGFDSVLEQYPVDTVDGQMRVTATDKQRVRLILQIVEHA